MRFPLDDAACGWLLELALLEPRPIVVSRSVICPEPGSGDTSHFALPS